MMWWLGNHTGHLTDHATWRHVDDGVSVRVTANCTALSYKSHQEADIALRHQIDLLQVRTQLDLQVKVQTTGSDNAILVATWLCNSLEHDFASGLHHMQNPTHTRRRKFLHPFMSFRSRRTERWVLWTGLIFGARPLSYESWWIRHIRLSNVSK